MLNIFSQKTILIIERSYEANAEDFLNSVETQVWIRGTLSIKQRQALNKMYKRFKKRIEKSA